MKMSTSPGSREVEQTIYTVFSIVSSYSIQLKLQIVPQSDLKAVIAVTGFLASLMFLALNWARPEERIITARSRSSSEVTPNSFSSWLAPRSCSEDGITHVLP